MKAALWNRGNTQCPKFLTKRGACGGGIVAWEHTWPSSIPKNRAMGRQPVPAASMWHMEKLRT